LSRTDSKNKQKYFLTAGLCYGDNVHHAVGTKLLNYFEELRALVTVVGGRILIAEG
jgi:hypothetical protein